MSKQIVSLYYPNQKIGGAQLLFARAAEFLEKAGFIIKIYEHEECYISGFLKRKNINFVSVSIKDNSKFLVDKSEIFLLSLSYVSLIFRHFNFPNDTRFVFWDLHPYCLIEQTALSGFYKKIANARLRRYLVSLIDPERWKKIRCVIEEGTRKNGTLFMCNYNRTYNDKTFAFRSDLKLLPLPIGTSCGQNLVQSIHGNLTRVGWISRLERSKNRILTLLMQDMARLNRSDLELVVIGDGPDEDYIKNFARHSGLKKIKFVGKIDTEHLSKFLLENIDLGFSMGTSSLEFARRRIPSVLVPTTTEYQYFCKEPRRYEWLHRIGGFDVCTYKNELTSYSRFEAILNEYLENKEVLGIDCFNYVKENHNIDVVMNELVDILNKSRFSFHDLNEIRFQKMPLTARIVFFLKHFYKAIRGRRPSFP